MQPPYDGKVLVVFSDLDGTLLDHSSYRWRPAAPALEALRRRRIPLVLVSSKTRAEVEFWRTRIGNRHPFVVENGGAAFVPRGYFPSPLAGAVEDAGYEVIELGRPYLELVAALKEAAAETGVRVLGFHRMTLGQIRRRSGLPPAQARRAKQRGYDEPFEIQGRTPPEPLLGAIERRGLRWTRGGRFYHVLGGNDKATAVRLLSEAYRRQHGQIRTVGLGDSWNDLPFLRLMDIAVVIRSPQAAEMQAALGAAEITTRPGPEGWSEAVEKILRAHAASEMVP